MVLNRLAGYEGRPLLSITHSDRPLEADKCHLNYLEARYSRPGRLPPEEPFESLVPSITHSPYGGQVTLYDVAGGWGAPELVCVFRPQEFKPQHALWHRGRLWVLGVECLEVFDARLTRLARIQDPWLAGAHTVSPDGQGRMLVSCAASDAVLVIDEVSHEVVNAMRVPEALYGQNYCLERADSVVDHYITNDLQLAHLNCAWPYREGVLTSALIPGAIGWFDPDRVYHELLRGFVGCHSARARMDTGEIYFSDSCTGLLLLLDDQLRIRHRISTDSCWLHDAIHTSGDVFATALYDSQSVVFWDASKRHPVGSIDCSLHGGPQFLAYGC